LQQQTKTVEGIDKLLNNTYLNGMYRTAPASFILSQEVDPDYELIPAVPNDFFDWDTYLLQVCNAQLSFVLGKEKIQFDQEISGSDDRLKPKISGHFEKLRKYIGTPSVLPKPHPFPKCIIGLRKMISETIEEELY